MFDNPSSVSFFVKTISVVSSTEKYFGKMLKFLVLCTLAAMVILSLTQKIPREQWIFYKTRLTQNCCQLFRWYFSQVVADGTRVEFRLSNYRNQGGILATGRKCDRGLGKKCDPLITASIDTYVFQIEYMLSIFNRHEKNPIFFEEHTGCLLNIRLTLKLCQGNVCARMVSE